MYKRFFTTLVLAGVLFATGCASIPNSGSSPSGAPVSMQTNKAAVLGVGGAALGYALLSRVPLAGALIGGAIGYFAGQYMDKKDYAEGMTNCRWTHAGTADARGVPSRASSTWVCDGGNGVPGNRGTPPVASGQ